MRKGTQEVEPVLLDQWKPYSQNVDTPGLKVSVPELPLIKKNLNYIYLNQCWIHTQRYNSEISTVSFSEFKCFVSPGGVSVSVSTCGGVVCLVMSNMTHCIILGIGAA